MIGRFRRFIGSLPYPVKRRLYYDLIFLRKALFFGRSRFCDVCRSRLKTFKPFGDPVRVDAWCPVCGSRERQRLLWMLLEMRLADHPQGPTEVLDIAPDPMVSRRLAGLPGFNCTTGDLEKKHVDVQLDITSMPFDDRSFDMVFCSHVLEHVPEDRQAMQELYRVVRPGGVVFLQVPISGQATFEDETIVRPEERRIHFGQEDHVRVYGLDIVDRLSAVGFEVETVVANELAGSDDLRRLGIPAIEYVFLAKK